MGADADATPFVRVVVVNFNGGPYVLRCVGHVLAVDWPADRLEVVLVDNASTDGSRELVESTFPTVRVIRSPTNVGFAGGCNLAMIDLEGVDFVAIVNNDAFVAPDWLRPLVEAFATKPQLGAACPKILLEPRFAELWLRAPTFVPDGPDSRSLGVRVSGLDVDGEDVFDDAVFAYGFSWPESGGASEPHFRWSTDEARIWVPVPRAQADGAVLKVRLAAETTKEVEVAAAGVSSTVAVSTSPKWFDLAVDHTAFDVVNNVGNALTADLYGVDRGFREPDRGQYEEPCEVFGWCGAAVVLSAAYLDDVGLFDERFFLYYEDLDLSWRGRRRGWRYLYVPASVVRHRHAATSSEGSSLFDHYNQRNRLLMLARNATGTAFALALVRYLLDLTRHAWGEVALPLLRGRRPVPHHTLRWLRALGGFLRVTMRARRRERARYGRGGPGVPVVDA